MVTEGVPGGPVTEGVLGGLEEGFLVDIGRAHL